MKAERTVSAAMSFVRFIAIAMSVLVVGLAVYIMGGR